VALDQALLQLGSEQVSKILHEQKSTAKL
jgi:hypothetical protein